MDDNVITNVEVIRRMNPDLVEDLNDDVINAAISNAQMIAIADKFPKFVIDVDGEQLAIRDMATRAMAMHLIQVAGSTGQGVTSEKVAALEVKYADTSRLKWLNRSPWGQLYMRWYDMYGGGSINHYVVVRH